MRLVLDRISRDLEGIICHETWRPQQPPASYHPGVGTGIENPDAAFWQTTITGDTTRGDLAEVGYFVRIVGNSKPIRGELCRIEIPPLPRTQSSANRRTG